MKNEENPPIGGNWYAAKVIDKRGPDGPAQTIKDFNFEISMLSRVKASQNVVRLIDAFKDSRFCYVVMECCGPTVLDASLQRKDANESDLANVFAGMIAGIDHCHSLNIIHRDVKP